MTHILVAVDGSEHSQMALGWARELAKNAHRPVIHLIHVYKVPVLAGSPAKEDARQELMHHGEALIGQAAESVPGMAVQIHLLEGTPAVTVLQVAERIGADLIAVGRRGLGPAAGLILGSVSTDIIHRSKAPVLVVHDSPPRHIRSVLVGVDGSAHSARALGFAARWAPEATLTAMHVLHVPEEAFDHFRRTDLSVDMAIDREARTVVYRTAETARVPVERLQVLASHGHAAEQLVYEYRSGGYDLAAVGSRGLGTLGEMILGSVSERLLRLANGPVVVAK